MGLVVVALFFLTPVQAGQSPTAIPLAGFYERATNEFAAARFYKPAGERTNDMAFTLAPLIIQEIKNAQGDGNANLYQFGTLISSNGLPVVEMSSLTINWQTDPVQLNGKTHPRFTYWWYYPAPEPARGESSPSLQGIRITLDASGRPVIWEVLADRSGAKLIFVAQSLETAAQAEFGKPLPGRRYSIERSVSDAPDVVVARVIDDGPVAMGPIVYLQASTRNVSTVICRCMPAQVKKLLGTSTYDLASGSDQFTTLRLMRAKLNAGCQIAFWPGSDGGSNGMENLLRLPSLF